MKTPRNQNALINGKAWFFFVFNIAVVAIIVLIIEITSQKTSSQDPQSASVGNLNGVQSNSAAQRQNNTPAAAYSAPAPQPSATTTSSRVR